MKSQNFGLQQSHIISGKDWILGGVNGLSDYILRENGQYSAFIPEGESQNRNGFDVYGCVSFAILNATEIYLDARYGDKINLSDRYLASKSGTICNFGNYFPKVAETLRLNGCPLENEYEWGGDNCPTYMQEPSIELDDLAKKFIDKYDFRWYWAYNTSLSNTDETKEALKYSPIVVSLAYDYSTIKNGIFQRTEINPYHAVTLFGYSDGQYWTILDHYDWKIKKLSWDYYFGAKLGVEVTKKINQPDMSNIDEILKDKGIDKGTFFVQQTGEGATGEFGLLIDSKLYLDDVSLLNATYNVRGGKPGGGLTPYVWSNLKQFNLKNEPLN